MAYSDWFEKHFEKTKKYIVKIGMTGAYDVNSVLLCYNSTHLFLISEY